MTPPFVRSGEAWQACFDCGQPVVLKIERAVQNEGSAAEAEADPDGAAEEAKLRRRYEVLLKALEGMLVSEAEYRSSRGVLRPEPPVLVAARQDLCRAVAHLESVHGPGDSDPLPDESAKKVRRAGQRRSSS